ncbi:MAG: Ig-like domain-containing protein [Caulobacteraceae bacterium]
MITTVKTIAGLLAALKTARGGDTILLAPGTYDAVALNNIKFKSMVTIASADPTHQAVLSNLSMSNDAYITFKQLSITTSTGTAATVYGSNHIAFTQDTFSGVAAGTGNALMLRNSDSITVTGSNFGKFGTGINLLTDSNLTISNNVFHDITGGDIRGTGVTSSTITGNTFSNADPTIASHVDVINLWQDNTANHVVIDANIYGSTSALLPATLPATPGMPSDASLAGGYLNAAHDTINHAINGVAGAGLSVTVYDNGAKVGMVTADSSGAWSFLTGLLADGSSHSYTVTATDLSGNTSAASAALNFKVDTSAPVQPGAPADASVSNGYVNAAHDTATQALGGTTEAGASVAVYDNGTKVATVTANNAGAWSYQVGALADGSSHSYTVTATDLAGNTSAASAALNFKVDTSAPVQPATPTDASVINGHVDAAHNTATQAIGGTTEAGASVVVYDNGTKLGTVTANNLGAWSYQVGALAAGSNHSYTVTATDLAGNTSAASAALNFTVDAAATSTPPASAVEVSNVQQLLTALAAAHAGDVITLDAGVYDAASLNNLNFTGGAVTITSTDAAHHAVLSNLSIGSSSGLTFDHVDLTTSTGTAVNMQGVHGIVFSNDTFSSTGGGNAAMVRDSDGITVSGSDLGYFGTGINVLTDSGLTVTNNVFHDIVYNGVRGTGLTSSSITGNTFADAGSTVYLWQDNVANNVTIANNVYVGGTSTNTSTTSSSSSSTTTTTTTPTTPTSGPQTVTVTNTSELVAAVWAAHGGDTIKLAAGTYDYAALDGLKFDSTVHITSADFSHQAVINGMEIAADTNMAFDHLTIQANGATGLSILGDTNVSFSNMTVGGDVGTIYGLGAMVRGSTNVSISDSVFSWLGSGVAQLDNNGLTISNNIFHDIEIDGVVGSGSSNVVVSGNSFSTFHPQTGDHPDAIQFFADSDGTQSSNILIKDNVITRGTGDPYQGIFIENTNHIEITGNAMEGTMTNGISLSNVAEGLVTNNFLQGWYDQGSRIITRGGSVDVTVGPGNSADAIQNYGADGVNVNYVDTGNTLIGDVAVGAQSSLLNAWLSSHTLSPASLSDAFFLH